MSDFNFMSDIDIVAVESATIAASGPSNLPTRKRGLPVESVHEQDSSRPRKISRSGARGRLQCQRCRKRKSGKPCVEDGRDLARACIQCESAGLTAEQCGLKTLPEKKTSTGKKNVKATAADLRPNVIALEAKVGSMMNAMNNMTEKIENMNRMLVRVTSQGIEQVSAAPSSTIQVGNASLTQSSDPLLDAFDPLVIDPGNQLILNGNDLSGPISWPLEPDTNFAFPLSVQSPLSSSPAFTSDIDIFVDFDPFLFGNGTIQPSWQSPSSCHSSFAALRYEPTSSRANSSDSLLGNTVLPYPIRSTAAEVPVVHYSNADAKLYEDLPSPGVSRPTLSLQRHEFLSTRQETDVVTSSDREDREKRRQRQYPCRLANYVAG